MISLRQYQLEAKDSVWSHLAAKDTNPCVVIPTGGGKTPVIASLCKDAASLWGGRVIVLTHVKELVQQNANKLAEMCPEIRYGIYSAGLRRRDTSGQVIVAGIHSVYNRACDLDAFDIIIIDEAHLIPPDGDGMYRRWIEDSRIINPDVRIVGLTATPYRLSSGYICGPNNILNEICYEIGVQELIRDGWLSPLISKGGTAKADLSGLKVKSGDYVASEVQERMDVEEIVEAACTEIVTLTQNRQSVLIFTSGIKHGKHVAEVIARISGQECGFVEGNSSDRDTTIARFKGEHGQLFQGKLKYLANVNVLTTGFDCPHVDCVVLLRSTLSAGLYYQMVGRGFRTHVGKSNCLVLDYGDNIITHGPVDQIKVREQRNGGKGGEPPAKECPNCHAIILAVFASCPECQHIFPAKDPIPHSTTAESKGILSGQFEDEWLDVFETKCYPHNKKGADENHPRTLCVRYKVDSLNWKAEWVCIEHPPGSFARRKAEAWWRARSNEPCPTCADEAVDHINANRVAKTLRICVRSVAGEKYDRIVNYELSEKPKPIEVIDGLAEPGFEFGFNASALIEDEIPF